MDMNTTLPWLAKIRRKNREQFGLAGLGQQDTSAEGVASALERARAARTAASLSEADRAALIRAREVLASDPRTAALVSLDTPQQAPAPAPIPRTYLWVGVGLLTLMGIVAFWPRKSS